MPDLHSNSSRSMPETTVDRMTERNKLTRGTAAGQGCDSAHGEVDRVWIAGQVLESGYESGVLRRALRYGDGLFATLRIDAGQLLDAERHAGRLLSGAAGIGLDPPPGWPDINQIVERLLEAAVRARRSTSWHRLTSSSVSWKPPYILARDPAPLACFGVSGVPRMSVAASEGPATRWPWSSFRKLLLPDTSVFVCWTATRSPGLRFHTSRPAVLCLTSSPQVMRPDSP